MNARTLAFVTTLSGLLVAGCGPSGSPPPNASASAPTAAAASSASGGGWHAPRTSWGDPNIEGIYTNKDENGVPMERPAEFEGRKLEDVRPEELSALIAQRQQRAEATAGAIGGEAGEDTGAGPPHWYEHLGAQNHSAWLVFEPAEGKVPALTSEGQARGAAARAKFAKRERPDTYTDMSLYDRCISRGIPGSMTPAIYGNSYDITQGPGFVAIRYEMIHEARIIPLDGSPHVAANITSYTGDARGHWDGDTLVVETTNFREGAAYRNASTGLKLVERFTPVDAGTLRWEARFEDAATWTAPWAFAMPLKRDDSQAPFEYGCHEGNRGLQNILSAARAEDRADAAKQPANQKPAR